MFGRPHPCGQTDESKKPSLRCRFVHMDPKAYPATPNETAVQMRDDPRRGNAAAAQSRSPFCALS